MQNSARYVPYRADVWGCVYWGGGTVSPEGASRPCHYPRGCISGKNFVLFFKTLWSGTLSHQNFQKFGITELLFAAPPRPFAGLQPTLHRWAHRRRPHTAIPHLRSLRRLSAVPLSSLPLGTSFFILLYWAFQLLFFSWTICAKICACHVALPICGITRHVDAHIRIVFIIL